MTLDKTVRALTEQEVTEESILKAYLSAIHAYMKNTGKSTIQLSGSCGGGRVTSGMIDNILQTGTIPSVDEMLSIYSSPFRVLTQENEKEEYHNGNCRICHQHTEVGPCEICRDCKKAFD